MTMTRKCDLCLGWGVKLYPQVAQPIQITKMEAFDDRDAKAKGKLFAPCPKCGSSKDNPTDKNRDWV